MTADGKTGAAIIAYLGKGGTGKTALSSLTARLLLGDPVKRLLLIDADPAMGLVFALGEQGLRTVGDVREEIIRQTKAKKPGGETDRERLSMTVDYLMLEALQERTGYSFLAMGSTEGPGCYCPVNYLLRESIDELSGNFDYIVIDAEAGIEQVSRQVTRNVNYPIIVTDSSLRGAATAEAIKAALKRTSSPPPTGVIFNRAEVPAPSLVQRLVDAGIPLLGSVPPDENLARFDLEGRPLLELPPDSPSLLSLKGILTKLLGVREGVKSAVDL